MLGETARERDTAARRLLAAIDPAGLREWRARTR